MPPRNNGEREIDDLSLTVGELKARINLLEQQQTQYQSKIDGYRSDWVQYVTSQSVSMQTLSDKVSNTSNRVDSVEKLAHEYREERDKRRGRGEAVKWLKVWCTILGGILSGVATWFGLTLGKQ